MAKGAGRTPNRPLLQLANSPNVQSVEEQIEQIRKVHDQEWNMCATDFWYFAEGYLETDDEEKKEIRPFPNPEDWPNLKRLHETYEKVQKVIVRKPRRQMVTNYAMARFLWKAFFAGSSQGVTESIFYGCVQSIGETEGNDLMGRISTMYRRLPEWMRIRNPIEKDNEMFKKWPNGGRIQAFPSKKGGPQGFGFSEVFFDEMARQEWAESVWEGIVPTLGASGKLLAISTVEGEDDHFWHVWSNEGGYYNDITRIDMDWWEPKDHTEEWFKIVTSNLPPGDIARMYLKNPVGRGGGKPVWFDVYNDKMHCVPAHQIQVNTNRPIFLGFDLGYHFPALLVAQLNTKDQFVGIAEFLRYDIDLPDFCDEAILFLNTLYDRNRIPEIIFVPPDAKAMRRAKSRLGGMTDWKDLEVSFSINHRCQIRMGANKLFARESEPQRLKEVRRVFKIRADGEPGFYFSDQMDLFRKGCQGGYSYPKSRFGVQSEEPMESKHTHIQDAFQMIVTGYNRFFSGKQFDESGKAVVPKTTAMPKRRIGFGTGM